MPAPCCVYCPKLSDWGCLCVAVRLTNHVVYTVVVQKIDGESKSSEV